MSLAQNLMNRIRPKRQSQAYDNRSVDDFSNSYTLNTTQIIQAQGLNLADQRIYAVRHRLDSFWDQISRAKIDGTLYEVIHINPDERNYPTSYDLVTVKQVNEHG